MKQTALGILLLFISICVLHAQEDSTDKKLSFTGDFRFRIEQDWNSRKSDGSYRDDRSRLRYRLRFGANYQYNEWASFGVRLRTGHIENQQDPQITLGTGAQEFSIIPIGLEKLFFKASYDWFSGWVGKNTYPFEKQNELFWSDNVYPEGIYLSAKLPGNNVKVSLGHFIVGSNGTTFSEDRYFQGVQLLSKFWDNRLKIFPSFYYFHEMPNIPDGNGSYTIDYSIFHLGAAVKVVTTPAITFEIDYYNNLNPLKENDSIPSTLNDENHGLVIGLGFGEFSNKGDWTIKATYTYLERYAAVDFLAQNDWVRWDYSGQNSPAGRLTNFNGLELMAGYVVDKNFKLKMRYFNVRQLIAYGSSKETGNRIRLDLDIGF